ncbi:MAG: formimidoylglutamase, partial [Pseudarthrobacter sp.]|nr:formimidoylglutamase [Pseudarthrobacter sp.]
MSSTLPAVDLPPQPWTGRFDGDGPEHRRWWQAVHPLDPPDGAAPRAGTTPVALLGFASDEGVRRNKGRTGAA